MSAHPAHAGDRLAVVAAAVLFSTGGAAVKACALSGWQIASLRSAVATVAILALIRSSRHRWRAGTLAVGAAYAATLVLYVLANKLTTAANTIFLQGTAPLYVLLLGPWLLREPLRRRELMLMAALGCGMALFFIGAPQPVRTAPEPLAGNLLALGAGACWALTIVGLRWLGRDGEGQASMSAVACGNLLAALVALPAALPLVGASPRDWLLVVYLGVVQIGLAYVFLTHGVRRVGALEVSLLLLVEPVLNPLWALIVHGEQPGAWATAGGAVIIAATAVNAVTARQASPGGAGRARP